jgi:hypothetical protein
MADHDRHSGSRGEEEAPRDPASAESAADTATRRLHLGVDPEPGGLRYGEQADRGYAYIPPTTPLPEPAGRSSFRDFLNRRKTQVVGVGVLGLVAGALLGGITVSAFTSLTERHNGNYRDRPPPREIVVPPEIHDWCHRTDTGVRCMLPRPKPVERYEHDNHVWTG